MREVKADVVFSAPPADYNLDHTETSRITFQALIFSVFKTIKTKHKSLDAYPAFFYMEPLGGIDWSPTHYVNITEVFERKCELLRCHKSQFKNMKVSGGYDLIDYAGIVGRFRGLQSGVKYAESFRVSFTYPRMTTNNNILP
jgi:LmbE family N-acetylglucosaminyl deacetylase